MSTAVQQSVLIVFAQSKVFDRYPLLMLLVIVKSGISGFLFVPAVLGLMDYPIAKLQGRTNEEGAAVKGVVVSATKGPAPESASPAAAEGAHAAAGASPAKTEDSAEQLEDDKKTMKIEEVEIAA